MSMRREIVEYSGNFFQLTHDIILYNNYNSKRFYAAAIRTTQCELISKVNSRVKKS